MTEPFVKIFSSDEFVPIAEKAYIRAGGNKALIESILKEGAPAEGYVSYISLPVTATENGCDFSLFSFESVSLGHHLCNAEEATIFIATIGKRYDILINRYIKTDPERAYCAHMLGMYLVEALCDVFEKFDRNAHTGFIGISRFSPGYGDLSLETQRKIFEILKPEKTINVTLNSSLLMSPSKTVSAITGYKKKA